MNRYFTNHGHHGVCIFRRRKTTEEGHRGFRLSSLGILLAKSARPRPWRHVPALKALINTIYDSVAGRGVLEPTESDWEPARVFFDERKMVNGDIGGAGDWNGWSQELEGVRKSDYLFAKVLTIFISPRQTLLNQTRHYIFRICSEYSVHQSSRSINMFLGDAVS